MSIKIVLPNSSRSIRCRASPANASYQKIKIIKSKYSVTLTPEVKMKALSTIFILKMGRKEKLA